MKRAGSAAVALYRATLRLYPADFRGEFAEEMVVAFADSLGAATADGPQRVVTFYWRELRDLPGSLLREHWRASRRGSSGNIELRMPNRSLYVYWILATAAAYGLAFLLAWSAANVARLLVGPDMVAGGVRRITDDYLFSFCFVPLLSLSVGALQYQVLRRYLPRMGWWVPATATGWLLAGRLLQVRPDILFWLVGVFIAAPQWLLLRRRLPASSWWLIANVATWTVQFPLLLLVLMTGRVQLRIGPDALWALAVLPACATVFLLGPLIARASPQPAR